MQEILTIAISLVFEKRKAQERERERPRSLFKLGHAQPHTMAALGGSTLSRTTVTPHEHTSVGWLWLIFRKYPNGLRDTQQTKHRVPIGHPRFSAGSGSLEQSAPVVVARIIVTVRVRLWGKRSSLMTEGAAVMLCILGHIKT